MQVPRKEQQGVPFHVVKSTGYTLYRRSPKLICLSTSSYHSYPPCEVGTRLKILPVNMLRRDSIVPEVSAQERNLTTIGVLTNYVP